MFAEFTLCYNLKLIFVIYDNNTEREFDKLLSAKY